MVKLVLLKFVVYGTWGDPDESSGLRLVTARRLEHALQKNLLTELQRFGKVPTVLVQDVSKVFLDV
jgi:hypothetical protein